MKIIKLTAENIKKLSAVEITPDGNIVTISGKNGAGKSSVLDSIWWALAGTTSIQKQPIRDGAAKGKIELDLGDIKVRRTFTAKGTALIVENAEGARFPSPQAVLDKLIGRMSFDPLTFVRLKPAQQADELRSVINLDVDLDQLDKDREQSYQQRRDTNRDIKSLEAQRDAIEIPTDAPTAEVSVSALMKELNDAQEHNRNTEKQREELEKERRGYETLDNHIVTMENTLRQLTTELENARADAADTRERIESQAKTVDDLTKCDTSAIQERIARADEVNEVFRRARAKNDLTARIKKLQDDADSLTAGMEDIDEQKRAAIAKADMPVDGLSIESGSVYYNGVPIEQASSAEQLRVSLAIAMRMNPKLRVIRITDGSLLDSESMQIVEAMAADDDYQIWIERVAEGDDVGVVIEDGHVKTAETKDQAA